jgi:uncharacterized protein
MATYQTPGVYVEEIPLFPPSVAEVATAIPAFIGYTERAEYKGRTLINVPTRITSQLEFREMFGSNPKWNPITVTLYANNNPQSVSISPPYNLFKAIQLFFGNGGGDCYIVSIGNYATMAPFLDRDKFIEGLKKIEKEDEPTLLLFPDAINLSGTELYDVQKAALAQCDLLGDRFCILDLLESKTSDPDFDWKAGVQEFRNNSGVNALKYGSAYTPHLKTSIAIKFSYSDIVFSKAGSPITLPQVFASAGLDATILGQLDTANADLIKIKNFVANPTTVSPDKTASQLWNDISTTANDAQITAKLDLIHGLIIALETTRSTITTVNIQNALTDILKPGKAINAISKTLKQYDLDHTATTLSFTVVPFTSYTDLPTAATTPAANNIFKNGATELDRATNAASALKGLFDDINDIINNLPEVAYPAIVTLENILESTSSVYANIVSAIREKAGLLPPSSAIAGVFTTVDADRGVWKAPANVSLNYVITPSVTIDQFEQETLNIDVNAGKSINAIRAFTGKGTLVWGARTLLGNNSEWRYIPVRRFFNMIEESIKKSTEWAVFEPNDSKTWGKVKGMIDNYLYQKWMDGALMGARPKDAYFVKIGLGLTMTPQHILDGIMIVEIGMAVVRPAEFIILRFSHKMAEI